MPRQTKPYWRPLVFELRGQGKTPKEIEVALSKHAAPPEVGTYPKARTISDIKPTPEEAEWYAYFRWPQAMEAGVFPWEASEPLLWLLARSTARRPTVGVARWFWRILQGAPTAPPEWLRMQAGMLSAMELAGDALALERMKEVVEWQCALRAWTPEGSAALAAVRGNGVVPPAPAPADRLATSAEELQAKMGTDRFSQMILDMAPGDWSLERIRAAIGAMQEQSAEGGKDDGA